MSLIPGTPEYEAALANFRRETDEIIKRGRRADRISGFGDCLRLLWRSVWRAGMYSSDPTIARMAMVHTAQEEIGTQRRMGAQQRILDDAREVERAKLIAREMAREMITTIKREQ